MIARDAGVLITTAYRSMSLGAFAEHVSTDVRKGRRLADQQPDRARG